MEEWTEVASKKSKKKLEKKLQNNSQKQINNSSKIIEENIYDINDTFEKLYAQNISDAIYDISATLSSNPYIYIPSTYDIEEFFDIISINLQVFR